jgi:hypothetical protein
LKQEGFLNILKYILQGSNNTIPTATQMETRVSSYNCLLHIRVQCGFDSICCSEIRAVYFVSSSLCVLGEVVPCYMLSSDLVSSCVDSSRFYGSWKDSGDIFSDTHKRR